MAVLNKVIEMKKQGMQDGQIIQNLKEEGVSPKEINEALSQSEIKSEISQENYDNNPNDYNQDYQGMQPSIMNQPPAPSEQQYDEYQEQTQSPLEDSSERTYQDYQPYQEYQPQQTIDVETINDLSSQIVEEKIKSLKKEVLSLIKFKNEFEDNLKNIDRRLNKLENFIEELQMAILKKIGGYGEDIKNISKEMTSQRDSFSKILNPLIDGVREMKRISGSRSKESDINIEKMENRNDDESNANKNAHKENKKKAKNTSFEDYLR